MGRTLQQNSVRRSSIYAILTPMVIWFISSESIMAQSRAEVSISVSANVSSSIEIFTIQTMDFGGEEIELGLIEINPVVNANAGRMVARGTPNAEIRINYVRNRELRNTTTNSILQMEYLVAGNLIDEQSNAEFLDQDDRDLQFNEDGEFYLWVGAIVDLTLAEPGSYEGEFSIEVEYI